VNRNFCTLTLATAAAVVLTAQSAAAQSGRIVVGGTFSTGYEQAQYGPQGDPRYGPSYRDRGYGRDGYGGRGEYAFSNGYRDGYEKGIDDARDRDRYDVRRHRRYRDAERGYNRSYGLSRDHYRDVYRRGFSTGYDDGYRAAHRGYGRDWRTPYRDRSRGGFWFDWKF
jgi:hypothetical protein